VSPSNPLPPRRRQRVGLGRSDDGGGAPKGNPIVTQVPQSSITGQLLEAAQSRAAGRDLRQPDSYRTLSGERPDLHTQLESIFHAVFKAEADARLDDQIDQSLEIRRPKSSL
jgi:hypothetical protein